MKRVLVQWMPNSRGVTICIFVDFLGKLMKNNKRMCPIYFVLWMLFLAVHSAFIACFQ